MLWVNCIKKLINFAYHCNCTWKEWRALTLKWSRWIAAAAAKFPFHFLKRFLIQWNAGHRKCTLQWTNKLFAWILFIISTVPNLKGDPNIQKGDQKGTWFWAKRGPRGDQKGTKKGTQNSSCSKNRKEITCWNFPKIESRRRKNYVCFLLSFKQTDISLINNF